MEASTLLSQDVKFCKQCGSTKPLRDFYYNPKGKDGVQSCCKMCLNARSKAWAEENRDRRRKTNREYKRKLRELYPEREARRQRESKLPSMYGITGDQYNELLIAQDGLCRICGKQETKIRHGRTVALAVDHCHATGRVRGLLCNKCNRAIGWLGDDPALLIRAAEYLSEEE